MPVELRDIAGGLWLWRLEHPDWSPEADWEPLVTCTGVESGGEVALPDPLLPPDADAVSGCNPGKGGVLGANRA